jgi:hypothetical protein
MNVYEDLIESEDYEEFDAEDLLDGIEELAERRRARAPRRPPRINPGRVARPGGLVRPPAPAGRDVTRAEFNAAMARVDKKIQANAEAIKKVTAQANRINQSLAAATTRIDRTLAETRKEVKRQSETNLLITLLNRPPALKLTTTRVGDANQAVDAVTGVEYDKQDNMLPLVLMMGSGTQAVGGDNIIPDRSARMAGNGANGSDNDNSTVNSSTTLTSFTGANSPARAEPSNSRCRSNDVFTASASNGSPSWNVTPSRRVISRCEPSSANSQSVASPGMGSASGVRCTSRS